MSEPQDLTGQTFSRLTVIERAEDQYSERGTKKIMWRCRCECGNETIVGGSHLKSGHTRSCGCLMKEAAAEQGKSCRQYNKYEFKDDYVIGYTNKREPFYFDIEDYDLVKQYCWHTNRTGYIHTNMPRSERNFTKRFGMFLHRLIMDCPDDMVIDHINHNPADNRKSNLRIVTPLQNGFNKTVLCNSTSGVTGVSWSKQLNKWRAYIMLHNKQINLGCYKNFEDAVAARKKAEEEIFGEYSYDNSIKISSSVVTD